MAEGRLTLTPAAHDDIGAELAEWGKVALIRTVGRVTGRSAASPVGFVEQPDGSLLVAAGDDSADWAQNLRAQTTCTATIGDVTRSYAATELYDAERAGAIRDLILKYGTPAERLGRGPAFRLVPGP